VTTAERKALRQLARAVRDGDEAMEKIRELKLDEIAPVKALAAKLSALRKVNERRVKLTAEVRDELIAAGVDELKPGVWGSCAGLGAQVLALLGK
jgi:hypothetical protein